MTNGTRIAWRAVLWEVLLGGSLSAFVFAAEPAAPSKGDLVDLPLEDLMRIEVTTAAKKAEPLFETASATYVITREDIERSGAPSIPEALRMAPGLEVARIGTATWAITARGFNGRLANKLLVMIDGRTVYTPQFAGVYWDVQDTFIEDVERIEVIRGPGASLWGANAVNGVINILTRKAGDTSGGLVVAGGGSEERTFGGVRYGESVGSRGSWRAYAKYFDRAASTLETGGRALDAWHVAQGGFRTDWTLSAADSLTVEGDVYDGAGRDNGTEPILVPPYEKPYDPSTVSGGNLLARWSRRIGDGSVTDLTVYADRTRRDTENGVKGALDTYDLDFQHQEPRHARHQLVWGFGYRYERDDNRSSFSTSFDPTSRAVSQASAFVQGETWLAPDGLRLTLGTKLENNAYTGLEFQPTVRLFRPVGRGQSLWGAVSRAVRTPSRAENDVRFNQRAFDAGGGLTGLVSLFGNQEARSEDLLSCEAGYRLQATERSSVDVATFFNRYSNLLSLTQGVPFLETEPAPAHLVIPVTASNDLDGRSYGVEISGAWRPIPRWKLNAWYSYFALHLRPGVASIYATGDDPTSQFQIRSYFDLTDRLSLDGVVHWVGRLTNQSVPAYTRIDLRVAWRPRPGLEASLVGQNLLEARHKEFGSTSVVTNATQVVRGVYGKLTWRF